MTKHVDYLPYVHAPVTHEEIVSRCEGLDRYVLSQIEDWCNTCPKTHELNPLQQLADAIKRVKQHQSN